MEPSRSAKYRWSGRFDAWSFGALHWVPHYVRFSIGNGWLGTDAELNRTWVGSLLNKKHACRPGDMLCLDVGPRPLLTNIRRGLIDPDTPQEAMTKKNVDGKEWKLVVCGAHTGLRELN
jgi:hypothetical protein